MKSRPEGLSITIHAIPNAYQTAIRGFYGDALKVAIHASPEEGEANKELCRFLAEFFDLAKRDVEILRGESSREKLVLLRGLTLESAIQKIPQ